MKIWSFGVEIEFFIPEQSIATLKNFVTRTLGGSDQSNSHFHEGEYDGWTIHYDGSLVSHTGKNTGLELVSPVFHFKDMYQGFNSIRAVMDKLRDLGAFVNRRCGFHIHVGGKQIRLATPDTLRFIERCWISDGQDEFIKLLPRHRQHNRYCRKNSGDQLADRYQMLNTLPAWKRHKTLEFRLFQGTLNPDRARSMICRVKKFLDKVDLP